MICDSDCTLHRLRDAAAPFIAKAIEHLKLQHVWLGQGVHKGEMFP